MDRFEKLNILITGPAGAGKSTVLDILHGFDLDEFGYRFPHSDPAQWLISTEIVEYRIRETDLEGEGPINYYGGLCSNMRGLVNCPSWDGFIVLVPTPPTLYRNLLNRQAPDRDDTHILELLDTEEGVRNYVQLWHYDMPRWLGSVAKTVLICYGETDSIFDIIDVISGMNWDAGKDVGVVGAHFPLAHPPYTVDGDDYIYQAGLN